MTRFLASWGGSANCCSTSIRSTLEGDLTRIKSIVVSRQTCAKISESLGMQDFLILGKGMTTHPSVPSSLLADVFESLVAAIYLDGGDPAAREFLERHIVPEIELAAGWANWATTTSRCSNRWPSENTARRRPINCSTRRGPDHSKCFKIAAQVGKSRYQAAWGRNKKEAEQRAARNALNEMAGNVVPSPTD